MIMSASSSRSKVAASFPASCRQVQMLSRRHIAASGRALQTGCVPAGPQTKPNVLPPRAGLNPAPCLWRGAWWQRAPFSAAASPAQDNPAAVSCWSCGARFPTGSRVAIFCGECGTIQPPGEGGTLFGLFGIAHEFDLNVEDLERRYKKLMTQLHPDRFMQKSGTEQQHSAAQSSAVNDGYNMLKQPHARAVYMLQLLGVDFDNSQSDFGGNNMQFMMEVMEASDEIEAAGDNQEKLREIWQSFYLPHLSETCAAASSAFTKGDLTAATDATAKLQYLKRVGDLLGSAIDLQ